MKKFLLAVLLAVSTFAHAAPDDSKDDYYKKVLPGLRRDSSVYIELFTTALRLSGHQDKCLKFRTECHTMPFIEVAFLSGGVLGQFDPEHPSTIKISPFLIPGSLFWKVTLVHEMTHYLDWRFGVLKPAETCLEAVEHEAHAYEVGRMFLKENGVTTNYGDMNVSVMKASCQGL